MNYEDQDRKARGHIVGNRGWPKQQGKEFTSCYYDYTKIHNFSGKMEDALMWPEKQREESEKVDDERDFMTENKDQYRTFAVPKHHEDYPEKDEVEPGEASPSPDERGGAENHNDYLKQADVMTLPGETNKSTKK